MELLQIEISRAENEVLCGKPLVICGRALHICATAPPSSKV